MKKLVPFKKDIVFDTNIALINSISLEHEVKVKKESLIAGKFIISGDYKMTDTSTHLDTFDYELPFNINIDKKYYIDEADVDISDFYYEVVNGKILSVSIELTVDHIEEREEEPVMDREIENTQENADTVAVAQEIAKNTEEILESADENFEEREVSNIKSLFDNLDDNDNYVVYKVHIMTENDTTNSLMETYGVTEDQLAAYNNLSEIKIGDKIIVPANEN